MFVAFGGAKCVVFVLKNAFCPRCPASIIRLPCLGYVVTVLFGERTFSAFFKIFTIKKSLF